MKKILTLLTASFILLISSFTFSSCKDCGKKGPSPTDRDNNAGNTTTSSATTESSGATDDSSVAADSGSATDSSGEGSDSSGSSLLTPQEATKTEVLANLEKLKLKSPPYEICDIALFICDDADVKSIRDTGSCYIVTYKDEYAWARGIHRLYDKLNSLVLDIDKEYNHGGEKVIFDDDTMGTIVNLRDSAQIDYLGAKNRIDSSRGSSVITARWRPPTGKIETFKENKGRKERLIRNWEEINRLMPLVDKIFDDLINAVKAHRQACGQLED
jgi:hypothetical protein